MSEKTEKFRGEVFNGQIISQLIPHPQHPFNKNFTISGRRLSKHRKSGYRDNFILMPALPQYQVSNLKMEIIRTAKMNIGFGIGSAAILDRHETKRFEDNVYFDFLTSEIWMNKSSFRTNFSVFQGSIVRLQVDLS